MDISTSGIISIKFIRIFSLYLIFLFFNLISSPLTKIPLPLYGSGTLHLLSCAANSKTTSFSGPSNNIRVGCGVLAFTNLGTGNSIGCEYPTFRTTNCWPSYAALAVTLEAGSTVARYPTPTRRRIAVWPSETPRIWFWRYARVVPGGNFSSFLTNRREKEGGYADPTSLSDSSFLYPLHWQTPSV